MRTDRTKRWKACFMLIVMVMLCIVSGGCGSGSPKDPLQDPTAVTTLLYDIYPDHGPFLYCFSGSPGW